MCTPEPEDPPEPHWLIPPTPSEHKGESARQCQFESSTAARENSYIGNSTDYGVESLKWLEIG